MGEWISYIRIIQKEACDRDRHCVSDLFAFARLVNLITELEHNENNETTTTTKWTLCAAIATRHTDCHVP